MKLFLAKEQVSTLMDGDYTNVCAVCTTMEKAEEMLKLQCNFSKAELRQSESNYKRWRYIFDGELTYFFIIQEIETDKDLSNP